MKIVIPVNLIPDLVEELAIDPSGAAIDTAWLSMIVNEFDDHAIEQGILLKESGGAHVTVLAPDWEGAEDVLFAAVAKGADQLIKISGDFEEVLTSHALARLFADAIQGMEPDLVLTGVQAHTDLDGQTGPLLAEILGLPYVGYVAGVSVDDGRATVRKEYPGGLIAEMEVTLPAVLGIQAAEQPPRYVAFSKVRQAMKSAAIDERDPADMDSSGSPTVTRMFLPETGQRATMLEGDAEEIADKLVEIFNELGAI
jgi:electron transfer flavoprotein beta subunit